MSTADLAQFIRYHKSTDETHTVTVFVGDTPVQGAHVYDDAVMNRLLVRLPEESVFLDVSGGPVTSRLNKIVFNGYHADVFLHA